MGDEVTGAGVGLDVSGLLLGDTVGSDEVGLEVTGDWDGLEDSGKGVGD